MADPAEIDSNPAHLYPPFAAKVQAVIKEANRECAKWGYRWKLLEGYRSQARETYLYAQGRTRPGKIVTNDPIPRHHGFGDAVDCVPVKADGSIDWNAPEEVWAQYGHVARAAGLTWGGDWPSFPDKPHIQGPSDERGAAAKYLHAIGLTTPGL